MQEVTYSMLVLSLQIKRMMLSDGRPHAPEVVLQEIDDYPIFGIVVDSAAGYIYWHTQRRLEYARLNGHARQNIHREDDIYSGTLVQCFRARCH